MQRPADHGAEAFNLRTRGNRALTSTCNYGFQDQMESAATLLQPSASSGPRRSRPPCWDVEAGDHVSTNKPSSAKGTSGIKGPLYPTGSSTTFLELGVIN